MLKQSNKNKIKLIILVLLLIPVLLLSYSRNEINQDRYIIIDRIEGGFAVCETESRIFFNMPLFLLPEGARDGSVFNLMLDLEHEYEIRARIRKKMNNLYN